MAIQTKKDFSLAPFEIKSEILSYLSLYDIASLARTSKEFHAIAQEAARRLGFENFADMGKTSAAFQQMLPFIVANFGCRLETESWTKDLSYHEIKSIIDAFKSGFSKKCCDTMKAVFRALVVQHCEKEEIPSCFREDPRLPLLFTSKRTDRDLTDKERRIKYFLRKKIAFSELPDELKNDRSFVLGAVKMLGSILEHVSDVMKDDNDIVYAAVCEKGSNLRFASDRLKSDEKIVYAAALNDGFALNYASLEFKDDETLVRQVIALNRFALAFASPRLQELFTAEQASGTRVEHKPILTKQDIAILALCVILTSVLAATILGLV